MPKRASGTPGAHDRYWQKRIRSKAFKRSLTVLAAQELRALAQERIADVLDAGLIRVFIREWDVRMINREIVADLIIQGNRRMGGRLRRRRESLLGVLDRHLAADLNAILDEDMELSRHAEDFIAKMMRQEFVRRLFTDIIFTSIVSFYEKVNPLFGGLTMRVLEEQIKGFIRLLMPMIQKQATAFAVNAENQRILLDFGRAIIRQLLAEPLRHYAAMVSPDQRQQAEALIRKAVANRQLAAKMRKAVLAAWDGLYKTIRDKQVGELLHLDEHAGWLAERTVEMIVPALSRPHTRRFAAAEMAVAARALGRA